LVSSPSAVPGKLFFQELKIEDDGIGFDEENFDRLKMYKDDRKSISNKGSGRLQLIHYFDSAQFISSYKDGDNYKERSFKMSASEAFLGKNSIVKYFGDKLSEKTSPGTTLILSGIKDFAEGGYSGLTADHLKQELIARYMLYFCMHRSKMPKVEIWHYSHNTLISTETITSDDIPQIDKEKGFEVKYSGINANGALEKSADKEELTLKCFKIPKEKLKKNSIKLTSKNEIIDASIPLHLLRHDEEVDGNRFLFLISGQFIDSRDTDNRGQLNIKSKKDFYKESAGFTQVDAFDQQDIFIEDIVDEANSTIQNAYSDIAALKEDQQKGVEELKEMFLLDEQTLKNLSINLNDTEEEILKKFYKAEAKDNAQKDAQLKKRVDALNSFDPTAPDYHEKLGKEITSLVREIPMQNRATLAHYVARRKLVLDLFKKINNQELLIQQKSSGERQKLEALLHSLIFKQNTNDPSQSDLWLINEDFIYFKGTSDIEFRNITLEGEKLFKDNSELTAEELEFRNSLKEDRFQKRADILLFPSEGKCIIIEFKSPDVNVAEHLTQINNYATLIRNFTTDKFQFHTFYGYFVGEAIEPKEVRAHDSDFVPDAHFDYLYRPAKKVAGMFSGRTDGSIYTEVLKYSTLLDRASKRNEIFIQKLMGENTLRGFQTAAPIQNTKKKGRPKKP
jgi:hypothetical protein